MKRKAARRAKTVSQAEYARREGISRQRIHTLKKRGKLKSDGAGRILLEQNRKHAERLAAQTTTPERRARDIIQAKHAQLRYEQELGNLVDRGEMERLFFRAGRTERDGWLGWVSRVYLELAAELKVDPHSLHTVLERAVRAQLQTLSELRLEVGTHGDDDPIAGTVPPETGA